MTNHFLREEHENKQDEYDYFDHQEERKLKGCLYSFKAMSIITLIFLIGMMLFGCAAKRYPATTSVGYVISVDGDEVLVAFEVVNEQRGSQASNWFYIPGHRYQKGDRYPDPAKDPSL
jgi:hypothetical protein